MQKGRDEREKWAGPHGSVRSETDVFWAGWLGAELMLSLHLSGGSEERLHCHGRMKNLGSSEVLTVRTEPGWGDRAKICAKPEAGPPHESRTERGLSPGGHEV